MKSKILITLLLLSHLFTVNAQTLTMHDVFTNSSNEQKEYLRLEIPKNIIFSYPVNSENFNSITVTLKLVDPPVY